MPGERLATVSPLFCEEPKSTRHCAPALTAAAGESVTVREPVEISTAGSPANVPVQPLVPAR